MLFGILGDGSPEGRLLQANMAADDKNLEELVALLRQKPKIAVLTGAGISAESGIPTFRGKDGLWKEFRSEELATPEAFERDPKLVWEWYNWRRGIIAGRQPNAGHQVLARWEKAFADFILITQNVDGLHRRAGSRNILELHGNIWQMRCTKEGTVGENLSPALQEIPPLCPSCGALLRPNVVWFGETLPRKTLEDAYSASSRSELMFVIGTSAFVQPAASLPLLAAEAGSKIVEINPDYTPLTASADFSFREKSGELLPKIDALLEEKGSE